MFALLNRKTICVTKHLAQRIVFMCFCLSAGHPGEHPEKQADLHRDSGRCRDQHGPGEVPGGQRLRSCTFLCILLSWSQTSVIGIYRQVLNGWMTRRLFASQSIIIYSMYNNQEKRKSIFRGCQFV